MNRIKEVWDLIRLPEMKILPGHLAFFLVLSLFPLLSLLGLIFSLLPISYDEIVNVLEFLPSGISSILIPFLTEGVSTFNIIFIVLGLYLSSNASYAVITASNTVYKIKNKEYVHMKVKSLFMTFWLIFLLIICLIVLAFGEIILTNLMSFGILEQLSFGNRILITLYKNIISFFFIYFTIKIIYTIAPDKRVKSKKVSVGAFFTSIGIIIVAAIYSFYITNFANYDLLYGNLANIVSLMLLIYFISYIFILGIAINSNYKDD